MKIKCDVRPEFLENWHNLELLSYSVYSTFNRQKMWLSDYERDHVCDRWRELYLQAKLRGDNPQGYYIKRMCRQLLGKESKDAASSSSSPKP